MDHLFDWGKRRNCLTGKLEKLLACFFCLKLLNFGFFFFIDRSEKKCI